MGFFDKILQGLGFEGEEEEPKKQKPKKEKKKDKVNGQYVLNQQETPQNLGKFFDIAPKNQDEVQMVVDFLKSGNAVKIDFSSFVGNAVYRAMDFVQGACYALGIVPQKLAEKVFLLKNNN